MRTLLFLLKKEFRQIFRNKALLPMILVTPIIQLLIMPLAADYEVKNINIAIVDHDHSPYSQNLVSAIIASGYFKLGYFGNSYDAAFKTLEDDKSDVILEIPNGFEKNLVREKRENLFIAVNAINGTKANLGGAYLATIISNFNNIINIKWNNEAAISKPAGIEVTSSNWYNPYLNYRFFMVPGILVSLVTMVGAYMCALNIVKEKEIGTIEQINVTPIKKHHFILGKLIPFWLIGIFIFSVGLFIVGQWVYGLVPLGSYFLLYLFLSFFLIAVLGIGLLISTYSQTQQQAMSLAFFCMMIFLLMSGLFTPIESMPKWAQVIAYCNPVTYFIESIRMIILKGSTFTDIKINLFIIIGFGIFFNGWAILNYKKTT
ncbi:ABC transporter permease [Flavobacterium sp.]|uniref:ABC transporter permease n=1 Tax=Flavobacterium sp. TaxID=239 RepID=UPI002636A9F5|nr:ABC transporter permease [Flavobacterium sp.]